MIKNKKGFTLIELMIVMAIIGILAVVALVAIAGKSVDARDSRRYADANAIQFAFSLYAIENGSDYLVGPEIDSPPILLNNLVNRADLTSMNLEGVMDPIAGRTDTCSSPMNMLMQCDQAGGYTLFNILNDGTVNMGTFDNYAIGIKLEQTEVVSLDWRKFVGINTAYAAGCDYNLMCDGEEDIDSCPCDCGGFCDCNFSGFCDIPIENALNCPADCGGGGFCGDHICNGMENPFTCPGDCFGGGGGEICDNLMDDDEDGDIDCDDSDCMFDMSCAGGPGGGEPSDTNDWLFVSQSGVVRTPVEGGGGPLPCDPMDPGCHVES